MISGLLAALLALSFAGCGSNSSAETTKAAEQNTSTETTAAQTAQTESSEESTEEKTLVIGTGQTCSTLDPTNSYDGWYAIRFGLCQTLTQMTNDMSISGWLVTDDYTCSEDMKSWTFTIRDGVTFSNGEVLTAEKAKKSLEYTIEHSERSADYFTAESIEADGQTLTINTAVAEPILPNKLADPLFSILDADADTSEIAEKGPVGTGPFIAESFDSASREVVVVKNEDYWDGEVKLDKIDFLFTEDQNALTLGMQVGDFDAVYNISMNEVGNFENNSDYIVEKAAGGRTTHVFMNQNTVLKDIALRQAIIRYLDRETYVNVLLNGQYVAGKTLVTASAAKYGYDDLTDPNAYDPESAAKLLEDAGYKDVDGDGYLETPEGDPMDIQFLYYTGRPEQQALAEAAQMELSKVGIRVTPVENDSATVMNKLTAGEYDMLIMSINVMNSADPENHIKSYFYSKGANANFGWEDAEFDAIIEELEETADAEKRIELVKDAEKILLDQAVFIAMCYPIMNFTTKANVSGIRCTTADYYWVTKDTDIQ